MSADEKAKDILDKFRDVTQQWDEFYGWVDDLDNAKECAVICVNEIIEVQSDFYGLVLTPKFRERVQKRVDYWNEALTSINNTNQ